MNAVHHNHNQGSIFDPILSLEAWRTKCDAENIGSVHVDLTFLEAFLGDESESKVRFQASLKRAVVKLYVSKRDPIKVVRDSVDRGIVNKRNLQLSERQKTDFSAHANLSVGTTPQILKANADIDLGHSTERELITTGTEVVTPHNIQQYVSEDMYC